MGLEGGLEDEACRHIAQKEGGERAGAGVGVWRGREGRINQGCGSCELRSGLYSKC